MLLSLALGLVVSELGVRLLNPYGISYFRDTNRYLNEAILLLPPSEVGPQSRIFQNLPDVDLELQTFRFATDDVGLRAPEPSVSSLGDAQAELRVLFLGDSVTLAWGVDDEVSWVRRLDREASSADGRPLVCMNAGHIHYTTFQQADLFAATGAFLRPDVVVVTFVTNDVLDDPYATYLQLRSKLPGSGPAPSGFEHVVARTKGWFWGIRGLLAFRKLTQWENEPNPEGLTYRDHPRFEQGWAQCREGFDRILANCERLGARLIVLDHGTPRVEEVGDWCEENGVPWYDLTFTDDETAQGIRLSAADAHANALGNRLLGEKAHRALVDAGVFAPREGSE